MAVSQYTPEAPQIIDARTLERELATTTVVGSPAPLPPTGVEPVPLVFLGLALCAAGMILLRRRKQR